MKRVNVFFRFIFFFITQVQKVPAKNRHFPAEINVVALCGVQRLRSPKRRLGKSEPINRKTKKKGLIIIARKKLLCVINIAVFLYQTSSLKKSVSIRFMVYVATVDTPRP